MEIRSTQTLLPPLPGLLAEQDSGPVPIVVTYDHGDVSEKLIA
jgi:hypothetical protein